MKEALLKFWRDEDGATAIEYGLIAGLIAVVIIGSLTLIGKNMDSSFEKIGTAISGSGGTGAGTGAGTGTGS